MDDWDAMIDTNLRGVLYGFGRGPCPCSAGRGSDATLVQDIKLTDVGPENPSPCKACTRRLKNAVRTVSEALRQEAGPTLRVSGISPGFVNTAFAEAMADSPVKAAILKRKGRDEPVPPEAIARCRSPSPSNSRRTSTSATSSFAHQRHQD